MSNSGTGFATRLTEGLAALEIELDAAAIERLQRYFVELKKWNARINLIAKASADDQIIESHFLDSLTLLPLLQGDGVRLLDVGSGAGFPGLVLKAAKPEMAVTLVEPRSKRVFFLRHIGRTLQLPELTVHCCRVEEQEQLPDNIPVSHITSRAVSDIAGFLALVGRFTAPDLKIVCMKGPRWQQELAAAGPALARCGFVRERVVTAMLPFSRAERALLVFRRQPASGQPLVK
ncbi:MAG: 16S rRNA (guanine(527)-N(7))-methyltransferase RsmG [Desulfopila sp.]